MRRFLLYADDGPRLGHARRALNVARSLEALDDGVSVLLVTGADDVSGLGLSSYVEVLRLPGASLPDDSAERGPAGGHVLRERLLAAATETFRPDVLLVDTHPFGEDGELGPALEIARAAGGRTALGLPDVIADRAAVDLEWRNRGLFERIPDYYDRVLVYGQPDLLDPVLDCGFPDDVARMTSFCGYVVSSSGTPASARRLGCPPRVLATAGDGDDGFPLLQTFVAAAGAAGWRATVVAGPRCPPEPLASLREQAAAAGVAFRRFVPGLLSELASLDALVCTGGYNTLAEAIASNVPIVCVPRVEASGEQLIRARAFAARGLLRLVEPEGLDAKKLRAEVETAFGEIPQRPQTLDVVGDRRAAHYLLQLASRPLARARQRALAR
jgi:predicted glycosyltransferase